MTDDYKVGFWKPPKHTQFRKGKSGNPKGRPKGKSNNILNRIEDVLAQKVTVKTPDGPLRVMRLEALFTNWVSLAAKGDMRASRIVMDTVQMIVAMKPRQHDSDTAQGGLGPADDEILAEHNQRILKAAAKGGQP